MVRSLVDVVLIYPGSSYQAWAVVRQAAMAHGAAHGPRRARLALPEEKIRVERAWNFYRASKWKLSEKIETGTQFFGGFLKWLWLKIINPQNGWFSY